jgi:hypothetical protein
LKTAVRLVLALGLFAGLAGAAEHYDLVSVAVRNAADVQELEESGCIVNGPGPDGRMLVEVPLGQVERMPAAGWDVSVLMRDVTAYYEKNALDYRFHTYTQIKDTFMLMAQNNPGFVKFETLGYASNDSLLFALKITDNPNVEEDEPELMYEAAVHGDEKCATEPAFEWAAYLIRNYGVDPNVTYWVNTREIWVLCPTNPYGHIVGNRSNRNGYDCNRDYGYMWYYETSAREPFTQPETQLQLRLMQRNCFNFWQSGHGGTYFISTPWSYAPFGTRDSMEYWYLGGLYHNITGYPNEPGYRGMYQINGASKDYAYGSNGAIGWTVEDCIYKTPPVDSLAQIVAREHTAMKMVLANIDRGIRGIVTDSVSGAPIKARIRPMPINFPSFCDSMGDFHRYLRPGTYDVLVEANGYRNKTVSGVVVTADTVTRLNVQLAPDTAAPLCLHQFIAGRGVSDVSIVSTPDWALGPRDSRRFSMGRGGMAIFDFGRVLVNSAGSDFTVYEDDGDPEGYRIEVANDWQGPWTVLGRDTGTASFDLSSGGVGACRYVKVVDDSGSTSGSTAGFDLEAIEAVMSNAAALVFQAQTVLDSPPGGNNDGKLDPGETADLVLQLGNVGRQPAQNITATLASTDSLVVVLDASAAYGTIQPDSSRANWGDHFRLRASANTPREYRVTMRLALAGTGYNDSLTFDITVGELRAVDPIPDGPRQPARFWAYDDVDSAYGQHPQFGWVEINGIGTRLTLSDDQTSVVSIPSAFGPWRYYGQNYTQVSICSNGWISPGSTTNSSYTNASLPDGSAPANLCLLWDDLYPAAGRGVWWYHDAANHRFIVEYDSVCKYSPRGSYVIGQFIIYDTTVATPTGDNVILLQYRGGNDFASSTVGIEDPTATIGINCVSDAGYHRGCAPLGPGRAIKYTTLDPTGIAETPVEPALGGLRLSLDRNPVRGRAAIRFVLPATGSMELGVYDRTGRRIRSLVSGQRAAGAGTVEWDGRDDAGRSLAQGVYFLRLDAAGQRSAVKAVMVE